MNLMLEVIDLSGDDAVAIASGLIMERVLLDRSAQVLSFPPDSGEHLSRKFHDGYRRAGDVACDRGQRDAVRAQGRDRFLIAAISDRYAYYWHEVKWRQTQPTKGNRGKDFHARAERLEGELLSELLLRV